MSTRTPEQRAPPLDRARAVQRVLWITLVLNLVVAAAKIGYGYYAGALSVRADGFHSLTDSTNNLVGLVSVWVASRPADDSHPYGHHKFEIVAAGLVGVSLLAMAFDVVESAVSRIVSDASVVPRIDAATFVVLVATLGVNAFVALYERKRGRELDSAFLLSDSVHTRSDIFVTLGVIVTAICVRLGFGWVDAFAAVGIAGFIAWTGISVLKRNLSYLADSVQIDPARIEEVVLTVPGVASTHKIRTRGAPGMVYLDLHVQIAPHLNVVEAHRVTHAVIDAVRTAVPDIRDVMVHTEPAAPGQPFRPLPTANPDD